MRMPRLVTLSHYNVPGETPPRSPCSPASSPIAGFTSRSVSPSSPRSPGSTSRHSAFSLVYPKELQRTKNYLTFNGMNALMYANSLNPLVTAPYPPYMWHPIPRLFLPYSPANRPESLSPERATSLDQGCIPEDAKNAQNTGTELTIIAKPIVTSMKLNSKVTGKWKHVCVVYRIDNDG
ncbi:hypothetical protein JTB14_037860 [Gonioctena quinquepunctata]|nr:hypothetical protein JTB14_037860 [Gonioctena quinquepunctata]